MENELEYRHFDLDWTLTNMVEQWTEIESQNVRMPEGYVGNVTPDHYRKLQELWVSFFSVCDRAIGTKMEGAKGDISEWGFDTDLVKKRLNAGSTIKNSGIEKDDGAKDMASKRMEEANMEKLISTYGADALRSTFWSLCKQDHPDTTMLRFLRARKWDVERATAMLASTLKWRLDTGVDHMSENGDLSNDKEIPKYITQQSTGKVYALGCNINEQPVCYVHFKKHLIWGQPSSTMKKFIICQMESWRLLFVPPNDKMVILFDCTGFGPSNMDLPNLLYVLQCLQSYFPECLSVLYLHNAPWFLKQAWQLVKGLLDPVVRSKVVFTNGVDDLTETIPEDRLLEFVGGQVNQSFVWIDPQEGENDKHLDKVGRDACYSHHMDLSNQFEVATRYWLESGGKVYVDERRTLGKKLRLSQFEYEPYWRGLTVHHRNGDLVAGNPGIIKWEYRLKDGENLRQVIGHRQCKKTLLRELDEIAAGASVDFVEKRTEEMLADGSWGHWSTCEDLPAKASGFENGRLIYGMEAEETSSDIRLNQQELMLENKAIAVPILKERPTAVPVKKKMRAKINETTSPNVDAPPQYNPAASRDRDHTYKRRTPSRTDYATGPKGSSGTLPKKKLSFLENLKSIIAA
ncbi:hypothetical protein CBS101457_002973 [Exobasidium rhododendri]|nr:hypothetical protein CBS101457_002973 [Exobasidium rhododendri]